MSDFKETMLAVGLELAKFEMLITALVSAIATKQPSVARAFEQTLEAQLRKAEAEQLEHTAAVRQKLAGYQTLVGEILQANPQ